MFFTALISSCFLISLGALQGDQYYAELNVVQFLWKTIISVIRDIITASVAFGLIIGLDVMLPGTEEKNP